MERSGVVTLTHRPVLHFRTLSTNQKHPKAKYAFLECSSPGAAGSFVIRIMGDTVGALFRESRDPTDPSYLSLINWRAGTLNPVRGLGLCIWLVVDSITPMPGGRAAYSTDHVVFPLVRLHSPASSRFIEPVLSRSV